MAIQIHMAMIREASSDLDIRRMYAGQGYLNEGLSFAIN